MLCGQMASIVGREEGGSDHMTYIRGQWSHDMNPAL